MKHIFKTLIILTALLPFQAFATEGFVQLNCNDPSNQYVIVDLANGGKALNICAESIRRYTGLYLAGAQIEDSWPAPWGGNPEASMYVLRDANNNGFWIGFTDNFFFKFDINFGMKSGKQLYIATKPLAGSSFTYDEITLVNDFFNLYYPGP
jgi:hypothetical protein